MDIDAGQEAAAAASPPRHVAVVVGVGGGAVAALLLMLFLSAKPESSTPQPISNGDQDSVAVVELPTATEPEQEKAQIEPFDSTPGPTSVNQAIDSVVVLTTDVGQGSGFLIRDRLTVATNQHVIEGASSIQARFRDGTKIPVDGFFVTSSGHDLALLHLARPAKPPPLQLQTERVGETSQVWAIGAPQGLEFSTTQGIVSAYRRWRDIPEHLRANCGFEKDSLWVQTQAALSGGNSGGPLVTAAGEVLGINTLASASPEIQNVNFAVHSSHLAAMLANMPSTSLPLSKLPKPQEASRDRSDTRVAELDLAAWDLVAESLGDCLFSIIIDCRDLQEKNQGSLTTPEIRRVARTVARETLVAVEKLNRIKRIQASPFVKGYASAQEDALDDIHNLCRRVAELAEDAPDIDEVDDQQMRNILEQPFEILSTESKAIQQRLEWLHEETAGAPFGVSERCLLSFEKVAYGLQG